MISHGNSRMDMGRILSSGRYISHVRFNWQSMRAINSCWIHGARDWYVRRIPRIMRYHNWRIGRMHTLGAQSPRQMRLQPTRRDAAVQREREWLPARVKRGFVITCRRYDLHEYETLWENVRRSAWGDATKGSYLPCNIWRRRPGQWRAAKPG